MPFGEDINGVDLVFTGRKALRTLKLSAMRTPNGRGQSALP